MDYEKILAERKKERRRGQVTKGLKITFYVVYSVVAIGGSYGYWLFLLFSNAPREIIYLIGGVALILTVIALAIFVPLILRQKTKRRRKWRRKIDELEQDEAEQKRAKEPSALEKFRLGLTKAIRISGKELDLKNLDWRKTKALLYEGEITKEKCAVCKLPIEEKEYVMQCPVCQSLYHGEHLVEWLAEQGICPVCRTQLL